MHGSEFRRWAEHGTRHYGDDPWQFVRELLQNARDAGARRVEVHTALVDGEQLLTFLDDGQGMSQDHARRYLFRLYASSKDPRQDSAGEFGIGFWTVLRFKPRMLVVESCDGAVAWGVRIDERFAITGVPSNLAHPGTRVTLRRPATDPDPTSFRQQVRQALQHYGRCLAVRDEPRSVLRIFHDDESVVQGLVVDSPLSLRFRDGPVEGVVGLAEQPSVTLYARGLPVWQGTILDELLEAPRQRRYQGEVAQGLAPVFQLNGRRLRVDVQRRGVLDDRHLQGLLRAARRALARLVRGQLRDSVLSSPWARLRTRWSALWLEWLRPGLGPIGILSLALALLLGTAWWIRPRWNPPRRPAQSDILSGQDPIARTTSSAVPEMPGSALPERYSGTVVDGPAPAGPLMRYQPPGELWFRVLIIETHDVELGFVGDALAGVREPAQDVLCSRDCIEIELDVPRRGWIVLPVPAGFVVARSSVDDTASQESTLWRSPRGEMLLERTRPGPRFRYMLAPQRPPSTLGKDERARSLRLPATVPWPDDWARVIRDQRQQPLARKLEQAAELVTRALVYDDDAALAQRYAARPVDRPWLRHVLSIGRGDCDVINGVGVLVLRAMGIPARLIVGYVGTQGAVQSGLHAWIEYHDRGWKLLDLSQQTNQDRPVAAPAVAHVDAPAVSPAVKAAPPAPASASSVAASKPGLDAISRGPEHAAGAEVGDRGDATAIGSTSTAPRLQSLDTPASRPPATDWTRVGWWPSRAHLPGVLLVASGALLLFGWIVTRGWRRSWFRTEQVARGADAERVLARMLQSALLHPGAWRAARDLYHAPTLPALDGEQLSLMQASARARSRRLFVGRRGSPLVDEALAAGELVLDATHPHFGPVVRMLDGAVDLDRLSALCPLAPEQILEPRLRALRDRVQRLLEGSGLGALPLHFVASTWAGSFSDVDLENLRLPRNSTWPRRYIAIDVEDRFWRACAQLAEHAPARACYLVLHHLLQASLFTLALEPELRRRISRALLLEMAP